MYPYKDSSSGEFITSENLKVHPRMKELYKFFKNNGKLIDIKDFDPQILHIFSRTVLRMIMEGEDGWQKMLLRESLRISLKTDFLDFLDLESRIRDRLII